MRAYPKQKHSIGVRCDVYTCIRVYVYTFIRVYVYTFIRVYVYTCIHLYVYTFIRLYVYTCIRVYVYTCIRVYVYTFIRVYIYTCIHLYVYTFIHVYLCHTLSCWYLLRALREICVIRDSVPTPAPSAIPRPPPRNPRFRTHRRVILDSDNTHITHAHPKCEQCHKNCHLR